MSAATRYQRDQVYTGLAGKHRDHQIRVLWTKPAGDYYDVVRVACECLGTWRFLHLWRELP